MSWENRFKVHTAGQANGYRQLIAKEALCRRNAPRLLSRYRYRDEIVSFPGMAPRWDGANYLAPLPLLDDAAGGGARPATSSAFGGSLPYPPPGSASSNSEAGGSNPSAGAAAATTMTGAAVVAPPAAVAVGLDVAAAVASRHDSAGPAAAGTAFLSATLTPEHPSPLVVTEGVFRPVRYVTCSPAGRKYVMAPPGSRRASLYVNGRSTVLDEGYPAENESEVQGHYNDASSIAAPHFRDYNQHCAEPATLGRIQRDNMARVVEIARQRKLQREALLRRLASEGGAGKSPFMTPTMPTAVMTPGPPAAGVPTIAPSATTTTIARTTEHATQHGQNGASMRPDPAAVVVAEATNADAETKVTIVTATAVDATGGAPLLLKPSAAGDATTAADSVHTTMVLVGDNAGEADKPKKVGLRSEGYAPPLTPRSRNRLRQLGLDVFEKPPHCGQLFSSRHRERWQLASQQRARSQNGMTPCAPQQQAQALGGDAAHGKARLTPFGERPAVQPAAVFGQKSSTTTTNNNNVANAATAAADGSRAQSRASSRLHDRLDHLEAMVAQERAVRRSLQDALTDVCRLVSKDLVPQ